MAILISRMFLCCYVSIFQGTSSSFGEKVWKYKCRFLVAALTSISERVTIFSRFFWDLSLPSDPSNATEKFNGPIPTHRNEVSRARRPSMDSSLCWSSSPGFVILTFLAKGITRKQDFFFLVSYGRWIAVCQTRGKHYSNTFAIVSALFHNRLYETYIGLSCRDSTPVLLAARYRRAAWSRDPYSARLWQSVRPRRRVLQGTETSFARGTNAWIQTAMGEWVSSDSAPRSSSFFPRRRLLCENWKKN